MDSLEGEQGEEGEDNRTRKLQMPISRPTLRTDWYQSVINSFNKQVLVIEW